MEIEEITPKITNGVSPEERLNGVASEKASTPTKQGSHPEFVKFIRKFVRNSRNNFM